MMTLDNVCFLLLLARLHFGLSESPSPSFSAHIGYALAIVGVDALKEETN